MATLNSRIERLERRTVPGGLPVILVAADGPEGDETRQQAQRLHERGQQVILIGPADDALAALAEACI